MNHESLLRVYRLCHGYTHQLMKEVEDDRMVEQPVAGMNHPAWILGHLAVVGFRGVTRLTGSDTMPRGYMELFAPGSVVQAERDVYPPRQELLDAYDAAHASFETAVTDATQEQWNAPNTASRWLQVLLPTTGDMITHMMSTHEATHIGQLSAWRRAAGMPGVL